MRSLRERGREEGCRRREVQHLKIKKQNNNKKNQQPTQKSGDETKAREIAGKCEDMEAKWRSVLRKMTHELCQMLLVGLERRGLGFDIGFTRGQGIGDLVSSNC